MKASQSKQFLAGAAVAALLILPGLTNAAPVDAPVVLVSDSGGWITSPQRSFAVHAVKLDDVIGELSVAVKPSGPVTLQIAGLKSRVDGLDVSADGGTLRVEGRHVSSVWDWRDWFNFSGDNKADPRTLQVRLIVPVGMALSVGGLIGDAVIGDTMGPLHLAAVSSNTKIGRVGAATLALAGSGKIDAAEIDGPLKLSIAGSGRAHIARCKSAKADIAGAGDAQFGGVDGGLRLSVAGSGDVTADSINGPLHVSIAGSGSVRIANGTADPMHVSVMGSGSVDFGGMAIDPHISALGSANVKLKAYRGHLSSSGNVSIKVNGQSVKGDNSGDDDDSD
ncbi:MAG: DUF2807 domain-containing protein [Alphaproteobacteria bacterium]|nr:DUF2807 domain-containing protein [Alphaproteobacteria bacterium]